MQEALFWLAAAGAGAAAWALSYLWRIAPVGAGYRAKVLCSAVFVSGRAPEAALAEDCSADSYRILKLFPCRVDRERKLVRASFLGLRPRTAAFRAGIGATLLADGRPEELRPRELPAPPPLPEPERARPWPEGEGALEPALDAGRRAKVERAVAGAFAEPDPRQRRRTRAVVVVQDGRIVAERYAPGFTPELPLAGWSMSKGVLGALVGCAVGEGRLSLESRALLPEWSAPADPRREISLDDLLRMRSGLAFREVYSDPLADAPRMLFARGDAAAYAARLPREAAPGTRWSYSSGTSNIVARVLRRALRDLPEDYLSYPRRALFDPLGMRSAVFEPDAGGTWVGSSFVYATARDWARFGLLFLQDGVWNGARVLPEGWVAYCRRPTPESPDGRYGAHWWLKLSPEFGGFTELARRIPEDAYFALGHEGQVLTVIPSRRLVVVRLGLSVIVTAWDHAAFLVELLDALE